MTDDYIKGYNAGRQSCHDLLLRWRSTIILPDLYKNIISDTDTFLKGEGLDIATQPQGKKPGN